MCSISSRSSTVCRDGSLLYSIHAISPSSDEVSVPDHSTALNSSTTYRPASIGNCLTPTSLGCRIVRPVSSCISRMTASTNDSPGSTWPPGSAQPCQSSFFRFWSSALPPSSSRHTTASSTFSVLLISELPSIFLIVAENRSPRNHASRKTSARFLCFLAFSSRSWYNIAIQILSGRAAFRA